MHYVDRQHDPVGIIIIFSYLMKHLCLISWNSEATLQRVAVSIWHIINVYHKPLEMDNIAEDLNPLRNMSSSGMTFAEWINITLTLWKRMIVVSWISLFIKYWHHGGNTILKDSKIEKILKTCLLGTTCIVMYVTCLNVYTCTTMLAIVKDESIQK